jgi:hypothetical protein
MPGDEYEGRVEITWNGHFVVWKEHVNPRCDEPEDPDEEKERQRDEREREEQKEVREAA